MLKKLVSTLPKAELHIHIEGSLEPEMMFDLAVRNGVELAYPDVDSIRKAYNFSCLQDFLDIYYQGMSVLLTEQDFHDLTWAYLKRCAGQNVVHSEIFFDHRAIRSAGCPSARPSGVSTRRSTGRVKNWARSATPPVIAPPA